MSEPSLYGQEDLQFPPQYSLHYWSALCFPLSASYESSADIARSLWHVINARAINKEDRLHFDVFRVQFEVALPELSGAGDFLLTRWVLLLLWWMCAQVMIVLLSSLWVPSSNPLLCLFTFESGGVKPRISSHLCGLHDKLTVDNVWTQTGSRGGFLFCFVFFFLKKPLFFCPPFKSRGFILHCIRLGELNREMSDFWRVRRISQLEIIFCSDVE